MAQRDYEEQPEAPDLGASAQLESEEHLAAPAGDRDALDAGYSPPDRPYGVEEDGVTARGMREGDTLEERLGREQVGEPADPGRAGRIAVAEEGAALETPDAMDGVDHGVDGGAAGAEEAAVHVVDDSGEPVEAEPSVAGSPAPDDPDVEADVEAAAGDDPAADLAMAEAARDVRADGDVFDPEGELLAEGSESVRGPAAAEQGLPERTGGSERVGGEPAGGDRSGRGPDPALPRDPLETDPARREFPGDGSDATTIDESPESGGAAAGASGTRDAGPDAWR